MILLGIIVLQELFIVLIVGLFFFLFPLIAIIDIVRSKFEGNMQLIWVLIVIFFNVFGSILYFSIGRNQKIFPES